MISLNEYNEKKFKGLFILREDKEYADVVFLYKSTDDVKVEDTHYIMSHDYTGYVKCCGKGCPACAKGIHLQTKIPIPLYNITTKELQIWDRNIGFQYILTNSVLKNHPNPSEVVFRITRNGAPRDLNTTYDIVAQGMNISQTDKQPLFDMNKILAENGTTVDQMYGEFCRDFSIQELHELLYADDNGDSDDSGSSYNNDSGYKLTPRNTGASNSYVPNSSDTDEFMNIPDGLDEDVPF